MIIMITSFLYVLYIYIYAYGCAYMCFHYILEYPRCRVGCGQSGYGLWVLLGVACSLRVLPKRFSDKMHPLYCMCVCMYTLLTQGMVLGIICTNHIWTCMDSCLSHSTWSSEAGTGEASKDALKCTCTFGMKIVDQAFLLLCSAAEIRFPPLVDLTEPKWNQCHFSKPI
jgi:hypothetical protein